MNRAHLLSGTNLSVLHLFNYLTDIYMYVYIYPLVTHIHTCVPYVHPHSTRVYVCTRGYVYIHTYGTYLCLCICMYIYVYLIDTCVYLYVSVYIYKKLNFSPSFSHKTDEYKDYVTCPTHIQNPCSELQQWLVLDSFNHNGKSLHVDIFAAASSSLGFHMNNVLGISQEFDTK